MKRKTHEDVRFWSTDDSVLVTECGGVVELQHHSRICLILVAVEIGESVRLYLNCEKALGLGISHTNSPCRSKRRVNRLSRPNELLPSQFVATLSLPANHSKRAQ